MKSQSVEFTPYLWELILDENVSKANGIQPALELCVLGLGRNKTRDL
jgi:hypothetical protein